MSQKRRGGTGGGKTQSKKTRTNESIDEAEYLEPSVAGGYESSSSSSTVRANRYTPYFEIETVNNGKIGICKMCTPKKIPTDIKMQDSNTLGLKWHLQRNHLDIYNKLFPSKIITDTSQRSLRECFAQVQQGQVKLNKFNH